MRRIDRKEFVTNFKKFYLQMKKDKIDVTVQEAMVLYAIYRRDLRTKVLNNDKFINTGERRLKKSNQLPRSRSAT